MLDKTVRINYLFDFYQPLLTSKQRKYMSMYYLEDYSLGEIAEQFQISRQAVYDNIKRTETMLEEYEEKLSLFDKFKKRTELVAKLNKAISALEPVPEEIVSIVEALEKLEWEATTSGI